MKNKVKFKILYKILEETKKLKIKNFKNFIARFWLNKLKLIYSNLPDH